MLFDVSSDSFIFNRCSKSKKSLQKLTLITIINITTHFCNFLKYLLIFWKFFSKHAFFFNNADILAEMVSQVKAFQFNLCLPPYQRSRTNPFYTCIKCVWIKLTPAPSLYFLLCPSTTFPSQLHALSSLRSPLSAAGTWVSVEPPAGARALSSPVTISHW